MVIIRQIFLIVTLIGVFIVSVQSLVFTSSIFRNSVPKKTSLAPVTDNHTTSTHLFSTVMSEESVSQSEPVLSLPSPTDNHHLAGTESSSLVLDSLGPIVVCEDGSLQRIANWSEMTPHEQQNTVRIISQRNKKRLEALKEKEKQSELIETSPH